jgi:hypothetical protein
MPKPVRDPVALPVTRLALRTAVVLNWSMAFLILALLFLLPNREWIVRALHLDPSLDAERVVFGLRAIAALGLPVVLLNAGILRRLLAIVGTVQSGDPFVAANAERLRAIAWSLAALQIIGLVMGAIARSVSTPSHPVDLDVGFSINGWLAVLLTFLLAQVFREGTAMRDDLQGTV